MLLLDESREFSFVFFALSVNTGYTQAVYFRLINLPCLMCSRVQLVGSRAKRFLFKENFPVFKQALSAGFFLMIFIKHYFSALFIILEGFLHESFILKDHMT